MLSTTFLIVLLIISLCIIKPLQFFFLNDCQYHCSLSQPRNIFLHGHNCHVRIGDFGLACSNIIMDTQKSSNSPSSGKNSSKNIFCSFYIWPVGGAIDQDAVLVFFCFFLDCPHTTGVGTLVYAAPEQLKGSHYDSKVSWCSIRIVFMLFWGASSNCFDITLCILNMLSLLHIFLTFSNKQQLCFHWSPSQTCTASVCWLSSYFNRLEQRWSGPVPWKSSERETSPTRSARSGQSSPNTSWSWSVQSQAFDQLPVSFYRATSSTARILYVVTFYKKHYISRPFVHLSGKS